MKYAVISDVHSNLEALDAVLEKISSLGATSILNLGDTIGYNANPNECIEIMRKKAVVSISGNHDRALAKDESLSKFNEIGEEALAWTKNTITNENLKFLKGLRENRLIGGAFLMVHGSLKDKDEYLYSDSEAWDSFALMEGGADPITLAFFGHTHFQGGFSLINGRVHFETNKLLKLEEGIRYLINPGSVGQPRDGDERAAFLVYDDEENIITFHRVAYDIEKTAKKILENRLPERLAKRLFLGK